MGVRFPRLRGCGLFSVFLLRKKMERFPVCVPKLWTLSANFQLQQWDQTLPLIVVVDGSIVGWRPLLQFTCNQSQYELSVLITYSKLVRPIGYFHALNFVDEGNIGSAAIIVLYDAVTQSSFQIRIVIC